MSQNPKSNVKLGPRVRQGRKPQGLQQVMKATQNQVSFTPGAHDFMIRSHGIRLVHLRAIPDPRGMTSKGDNHAVGGGGQRSQDGFIYKEVGILRAFFSNNSDNVTQESVGQMVGAAAYLTLPEFYESESGDSLKDPVLVHPYDKFYLKDIETRVVTHEFVEANSIGIDRLAYPATCVEHLIDSDGIEYCEGIHFKITNGNGEEGGNIEWISQKRPGWNVHIGKGKIYSIRYRYTPFFIVNRIIHEIRVAHITDLANNNREVRRMPYEVQILREFVFKDRNRDVNRIDYDPRYENAPPSGGMLGSQ